jgi:hypothetical protein
VVRPEKLGEFTPALNEFLEFKKKHPKLFQGLKSWKLFKQEYGGTAHMCVEMWGYESLADMERISARIFTHEEMKKIAQGFHQLIESTSFSTSIWYPVA